MKNNHLFTALLAALLCLSLIACGTADALNNSAGSPTGPVIPIEDAPAVPGKDREPVSSCAVSADITVSLLQNTYPVGTQALTLVLENRGDETLRYGEEVSFEKFTGGEWKPLSTIDSYCFNSLAYLLEPRSMGTFTISPWFLSEPLRAGLYRVTGGEMRTGSSRQTTLPAWQVEFRAAEEARPEPDYAVFIPGQPLQNPENIPACVVNTTGQASSILRIPHLDRQNAAGRWEEVPYVEDVGFCGTSDPLRPEGMELQEPVEALWGRLEPGRYRLSFDITGTDPATRTAGGEFVIAAFS